MQKLFARFLEKVSKNSKFGIPQHLTQRSSLFQQTASFQFQELIGRMAHTSSEIQGNLNAIQEALLDEVCILVDDNDKNIGVATKKDCHLLNNGECLLHRAFSVFLFNSKGELLLQQRSDAKITFPSMFTNSCCSHPLAIESELEEKNAIGVRKAAQRKLHHELGIKPEDVPWEAIHYLTRIHYKAKSDSIWGEHEIDYILFMQKDVNLDPNDNEVKSVRYVSQMELRKMIEDHDSGKLKLTPWFRLICESHLFKWWNNLPDFSKFTDSINIYRY